MARFRKFDCARHIAWRLAAAFLSAIGALAAPSFGTTVDFENLSLAPNSYWNGADGSGGFASRDAYLNNSYDAYYGSWSGWAYSNVNDTTTPDYVNQYAAYTGTGVGGSGNYAVAFGCLSCASQYGGSLPSITIPDGMRVCSAMFTNTTYAALSMLNGDQFAKQFGPNDWFKMTVTGECAPGHVLGTVAFYLAQNGSIVNDWRYVDLSPLATAKTLTFDLTSSDNGLYGMNTPAYFAMDDLTLSPLLPGDFNADGSVDGLDLYIFKANLGLSGPTVTWYSGDGNCDGIVNNLDLDIWKAHIGETLDEQTLSGCARAVPEPSDFALLASCGVAAFFVRRRKQKHPLGS